MRLLFAVSLLAVGIGAIAGCIERRPVTVIFTSDVKGRLRPAG